MLFTIIIFVVVLSLLVFAHELGHFWTARKFGVKAEEFGFGFPPRVFGFQRVKSNGKKTWRFIRGRRALTEEEYQGDTVYSINWIPLGGFVKIKGQDGDGESENDSFVTKKIWKRAVILSAGVLMNIILAWALFSACFMMGVPKESPEGGMIQVDQVMSASPAEIAGIKAGDVVLSLDGQNFQTVETFKSFINENKERSISVEISRGKDTLIKEIKPEVQDGQALIGVGLSQVKIVHYSFFMAIWEGFKYTFIILWLIIVAFYELIRNLIVGAGVGDAVGGPVRIAQMTGEVARVGIIYLMNFTALLSLNLAVINFLPFPALDGGRVLFLAIEKIKGRPVKKELEAVLHNIGFILLMALVAWVTLKDILRLFIKT